MKLVFCLFEYFPFGGLQRDFLKITSAAVARGHAVCILAMNWLGERPAGVDLRLLPQSAMTNHGRCLKFVRCVTRLLPGIESDAVVGFNKMPGLDLYFAADSCYEDRLSCNRFPAYRLTGRYRTYAGFESAVFSAESGTEILLLSPQEKDKFIAYYGTQEERFHMLPPGVSKDRFRPDNVLDVRAKTRTELGLDDDHLLLLTIGSGLRTKGVDRALHAVASLPEDLRKRVRLRVIGRGRAASFVALARRLRLTGQVDFLGGRDDVPRYLFAADLLLHPARTENTGTVLVEALAAGLPVVATENCGYAFHVRDAQAGRLIPVPFRQETLDKALHELLSGADLRAIGGKGVAYAARVDLTGLYDGAVAVIEEIARKKGHP
jgi:UDP-glucose:(heptosyl)LPS alpha-1,3-glucosyltransferase